MNKFLKQINGWISKHEARTLDRAVRLLLASDKYDAYFFAKLQSVSNSSSPVIVKLDAKGEYCVVKTTESAVKSVATVAEV